MLAFVSFAPTFDPFGEGTEMRCVLHACVSYVFIGTLARRKKAILSKLTIIIRVRHDNSLSKYIGPPNFLERWVEAQAVGSNAAADSAESFEMVACMWGCMAEFTIAGSKRFLCGPLL
jgi:hypothetical protein